MQQSAEHRQAESLQGRVISKDGTSIAYEQSGSGPAVILVNSALSSRADARRLAALLSEHLTVINYDRRGRGESGDTKPYAVEREVEDIGALIDKAGASAFVFGHSSGAVLALEAANMLPDKIAKAALFEPPFVVDASRPPFPADFVARVTELVATGKRSEAVEYFMIQAIGVPAEIVAQMKQAPMWAGMEKLAHTLPYDGAVMGDTQSGRPLPTTRWTAVRAPTLIIDGENSDESLHNAARALGAILPGSKRRTLAGQDHSVVFTRPDALAPVLTDFFESGLKSGPPTGDKARLRRTSSTPDPALQRLSVLVGAWNMKRRDIGADNDIYGQTRFEWMEGGHFLVQRFDFPDGDQRIRGVEYIGYDQESKTLVSRSFDNLGNTFPYTWELTDDTLKVWFGPVGSDAFFEGRFSADRNTITGRWTWPGGGYDATVTRAK